MAACGIIDTNTGNSDKYMW